MSTPRKTYDTWELHTNYGYGWEHETTSLSLWGHKNILQDYRDNCSADLKTIKKRVPFANDAERLSVAKEIKQDREEFLSRRNAKKA